MEKYELLNQIGDGTFGSVAKAVNKKTGQLVAIKKMKQKFYTWEECIKLPEVVVVKKIHRHPNVVKLSEVIRDNNELFFVFEYMDGDLLGVIKKAKQAQRPEDVPLGPAISYPKVKHYMRQLLQALAYLHKRGYFHRDLKPENLLIRKDAQGEEVVKLGDFGLVKEVRARPPFTDYVSTRWYRAPELLLQDRAYNAPVDIFAAGCIMSELITTRPLFPGSNEVDQLFKIMSILGSPTEKTWPGGFMLAKKIRYTFPSIHGCGLAKVLPSHVPSQALHLMNQMLQYDPRLRPTAEQCLAHPYFSVGIDENNAATMEQKVQATRVMEAGPQTAPPGSNTVGGTTAGNANNAGSTNQSDGKNDGKDHTAAVDPKRYLTPQVGPPAANTNPMNNNHSNHHSNSPQRFYMVGIPKLSVDLTNSANIGGGANNANATTSNTNNNNNNNNSNTSTTKMEGNALSNLCSPYRTQSIKAQQQGGGQGAKGVLLNSGRSDGSSKANSVGQKSSNNNNNNNNAGKKDFDPGMSLDQLLSEFTGELNMQGIRTEKQKTTTNPTSLNSPTKYGGLHGSGAPNANLGIEGNSKPSPNSSFDGTNNNNSSALAYQRRTSLMAGKRPTDLTVNNPHDPVAALLNNSRYKKSSFSTPTAYHPPGTNTNSLKPPGGDTEHLHMLGSNINNNNNNNNNKSNASTFGGNNGNRASLGNSPSVSPSITALLARRHQQHQQNNSNTGAGGGFGFRERALLLVLFLCVYDSLIYNDAPNKTDRYRIPYAVIPRRIPPDSSISGSIEDREAYNSTYIQIHTHTHTHT
eukprot:gene8841-6222_t